MAVIAVTTCALLTTGPSAVAPPAPVVDPVRPPAPTGGVGPAGDLLEPSCPMPRPPGNLGPDAACNLPVVYLGGPPGPCPDRREPPESRVIPVGPDLLSR